jgi:hypothetical protein
MALGTGDNALSMQDDDGDDDCGVVIVEIESIMDIKRSYFWRCD